jgi:tetratricopeptide (TPR) repeat protein
MMKRVVNTGLALAFIVTSAFAQNLNDAKLAIDAEQYEKAKGMLKTLVANQGKKGENYFYLGQVYLLTDNPDSAKIVFDQGLQAVPKFGLNNVGLGAVDLYKGDEAAASAKFTEATEKLRKKDYEENLYIGRAYIIAARQKADEAAALAYYNKAVEYLEKAKAANQKDVDVFITLGDAYLGANRASDAYSAYWTAEDMDKTRLKPRVQRAVIAKNARAWQEAAEDLKKIAAEAPDYAPTYRELAETYHGDNLPHR